MPQIFISHSSLDNAAAIALRDWLVAEGWDKLFLDLDPDRGIAAGERWERALQEAARRCEAVIFLVSRNWLGSDWCLNELTLARRLNKRLFGVLIEEDLSIERLPRDVTSTWQLVHLAAGRDHRQFRVTMPVTGEEVHVTFSHEGLARLKSGLQRAGLHADYFAWPPEHDPKRAPYRGLNPLEAEDAGIFFGREAKLVEAIDRLRGMRDAAPPRLLVILGASGAGKSSFLRAGVLPRLGRDHLTFQPLPVIRPERAALSGETGLLASIVGAFDAADLKLPKADVRKAMAGGAIPLKKMLGKLVEAAVPPPADNDMAHRPPAIVIAIDQAEELFVPEAEDEAKPFLTLLRDLAATDDPAVIAIFTIRSDNYERLQSAEQLDGLHQETLSLPPIPKGAYAEIIKGPIHRLDGTDRELRLDDALVDKLLTDIEKGGSKDALPLLAFTLERLYGEYHASGELTKANYKALGRIKGSITDAVEQALAKAKKEGRVPAERAEQLQLLRRGLIPWLAGIDPKTGAPRRRVSTLAEIPQEARPLIDLLVDQRLLTTDIVEDTGHTIIEPAHEALLRQWERLKGWLTEDATLLGVMDGVERASRDWNDNGRTEKGLVHGGGRLKTAESLRDRPDLNGTMGRRDWDYLAACRKRETAQVRAKRISQAVVVSLLLGIIAGLVGWINQDALKAQWHWATVVRPYVSAHVAPHVLTEEDEAALKQEDTFRECAEHCPEMVVVPAGTFMRGSPEGVGDDDERPQREVTIARPFAVSKFEVTFDDWEECVTLEACPSVQDSGWGTGRKPVINVSWEEATAYTAWLSRLTGKDYRLLSEAEWEYAARAGTKTAYSFGDDPSVICDYANLRHQSFRRGGSTAAIAECDDGHVVTADVGSFDENPFGLYDIHGNVWEWTSDCFGSYDEAPVDGSPNTSLDCASRVVRGGSWSGYPGSLRSANRGGNGPGYRFTILGFRVARTLFTP